MFLAFACRVASRTMTKQRSPRKFTNIPAPLLPGLYSLQAVAANDGLPDVTVYRPTVEGAVAWKDSMAARGGFSKFLLRHADDAWDVYNAEGKLECLCNDVVDRRPGDQPSAIAVDLDILDAEAACVVGRASRVIHAEAHAAASAADHSNYGFVLRSMIRDADPLDLPHWYIVESHSWRCRVAGLYADVGALRPAAQDAFLDVYTTLRRHIPLDVEDHRKLFVNRLASLRVDYLSDVCAKAGAISGLDDDEILSLRLNVGARGVEFRRVLANELLRLTGGDPVSPASGLAEELNTTKLAKVSDAVVAAAFKL